jgi:hypothetical protein
MIIDRADMLAPAQAYVSVFPSMFAEYPSRRKAASFSHGKVMEKLSTSGER